jgi:hypothetical protein
MRLVWQYKSESIWFASLQQVLLQLNEPQLKQRHTENHAVNNMTLQAFLVDSDLTEHINEFERRTGN